MKNAILLAVVTIMGLSATAMADVKIKSKQTMSGQVSENTTYIKGKRQRIEMMGGTLISVTQCDLGRDLQLNPKAQTYLVNLYDDGSEVKQAQPSTQQVKSVETTKGGTMYVTTTIKDTGERKQMFGYTARHIIQTIETDTSADACQTSKTKMEMDMWVIDAEFGLACTQTRQYRPYQNGKETGCQDKIVQKTVGTAKSGYPLYQKMTSFDATGKESFSMIQEVIELSKATLDAALFEAPADYRQVKDSTELYAVARMDAGDVQSGSMSATSNKNSSLPSSSGIGSNISKAAAQPAASTSSAVGPKKAGTIRLGIAPVKTGAVGEGISAADLSAAVKNTLGEYLKGTKVEVVALDAKLASAQAEEAAQKECDFVVYANVSHKKGGGGGFGFGKMLAQTVAQTGLGHTGTVAGNLAGQIATNAIVTAGSMSGNVKKKDEMTLDLNVQASGGSSALAKQFKAKAQSDGDDIISAIVEQAAQAIVDAVSK